jgi:hypothetical protein
VYEGRRNQSKLNRHFHNEIKGKKWMLASELQDFNETLSRLKELYSRDYPSDIRGSELGLSPLECTIVKIIGRMDNSYINSVIDIAIANDASLREDHTLLRDAKGTPLSAKRGTLLHHLWNAPIGTDSIHLQLLEANGITPLDTTAYSELEIYYVISEEHSLEPILYTCHPDALLFLQDEKTGKISILTMDRKSNPKTPYPEPKYLTQVAGYNWIIEQILTKEMGLEVEENYVILDKNPGKINFDSSMKNESRAQIYRRHQFSPITLFSSDDPFYQSIPKTIVTLARKKQAIYDNSRLFIQEKEINEGRKVCDYCYKSTSIVCDYLSNLIIEQPEMAKRIILPNR